MSGHTLKHPTSGKATFSFYGDDDTGIDSDAANQVDIMCGGSIVSTFGTTGQTIPSGINLTLTSGDLTLTAGNLTLTTGNLDIAGNLTISGQVYNDTGNFRIPQAWTLTSVVSSIAGATTEGGFFAVSNPFGASVLIENVIFNLGTAATSGTATVDIGTATASNSSADNLFDSLAITTAGVFQNDADNQGTNGKTSQKWASNHFVTGTVASGNVTGAVGALYFTVVRI